jgi:hypothetical protein
MIILFFILLTKTVLGLSMFFFYFLFLFLNFMKFFLVIRLSVFKFLLIWCVARFIWTFKTDIQRDKFRFLSFFIPANVSSFFALLLIPIEIAKSYRSPIKQFSFMLGDINSVVDTEDYLEWEWWKRTFHIDLIVEGLGTQMQEATLNIPWYEQPRWLELCLTSFFRRYNRWLGRPISEPITIDRFYNFSAQEKTVLLEKVVWASDVRCEIEKKVWVSHCLVKGLERLEFFYVVDLHRHITAHKTVLEELLTHQKVVDLKLLEIIVG